MTSTPASTGKLKLDLGCGMHAEEGWTGVDYYEYGPHVKRIFDIGMETWPFDDDSVDEARALFVLQYLTRRGRIHFVNELWRVLKVGSQCKLIVPHWNHPKAYGDLDAEWPISEHWPYFLSHKLRKLTNNASPPWSLSAAYKCNFQIVVAQGMAPELVTKSQQYVEFALNNYKGAAVDIHMTLTKRPHEEEVG